MKVYDIKSKNYNLFDAIKISLCVSFYPTIILIFTELVGNLVLPIFIYVAAWFIDAGKIYVESGNTSLDTVTKPLILLTFLFSIDWLWYVVKGYYLTELNNNFHEGFYTEITAKIAKLKYEYFETSETWDLIQRINSKPDENGFNTIIADLISFCGFCIKLISVISILIINVWWAGIFILLFSIPLFITSYKGGKANYQATKKMSLLERKTEYFGDVLTGRESAAERSLFGYTEHINSLWKDNYLKSLSVYIKTRTKWILIQRLSSITIIFVAVAIMVILAKPVLDGIISIGMYIALINATTQLSFKMQWMFMGKFENIAKGVEYCKEFTVFSSLEEEEGVLDKPNFIEFDKIEFKNVNFKYPNTSNYILKDTSFTIYKNKHYALVGVNGAGKSTITKLLMRLYRVDSGEILIDGKNINTLSASDISGLLSVVHQDFGKYALSIKENVAIGDVNRELTDEEFSRLLEQVDLKEKVLKLQEKGDTRLGKLDENSIDLSGGEWQKIALLRARYNKGFLHILDEPTASMSPLAETKMYRDFSKMTSGRTTMFISHRLGSTKLADEILVIDDGKIIEKGTHNQLIKLCGHYYKIYESQRKWYE